MKAPAIFVLSPLLLYSFGAEGTGGGRTSAALTLPIAFEPNRGQSDPSVKFLAHDLSGAGYALFLTEDSAILATGGAGSTFLRMRIAGARKGRIAASDPLAGKVNYFIGNDPAKWISGAPLYGRVAYKQIYSGIDLFFYGSQRQLEYDFVVAPGANANQIALEFSKGKPRLDAQGNLELRFKGRMVRFRKPAVYQSIGGEKKLVAGAYRIHGRRVQFELGAYNRSRELVIDPVLDYLTFLGGSGGQTNIGYSGLSCGACVAQGVALDSSQNLYVTGYTTSNAFPLKNPYQSAYKAGANGTVFVAEINPQASALVYSTYLGGSAYDRGSAIAVDRTGSAYITGEAWSSDFPVTPGAFQTVCGPQPGPGSTFISGCGSNSNAFLTKLSPGGSLAYSTFLGGNNFAAGNAVAIDSQGRAYVAGSANGVCDNAHLFYCFPETGNALQPQSLFNTTINHFAANPGAAFVAVFDATGANLLYSTLLGDKNPSNNVNSAATYGAGVAVDSAGNFYLAGFGQDPALPTTTGAFQPVGANDQSTGAILNRGFVAKFSPVTGAGAEGSLIYATYLGGAGTSARSGGDQVSGIAADAAGNAYVTGYTASPDFPVTPGANNTHECGATTYECQNIGFLTKLDALGEKLVWSTLVGPSTNVIGGTMSEIGPPRLDADGNVYITGQGSPNYPITIPVQTSAQGSSGVFVTRYDPTGSTITFSTMLYSPASHTVNAGGIDVDSTGNIYIGGSANAPDLPATSGVLQSACTNCSPGFLAKIAPPATPVIASVANAESGVSTIAPNTWVEILGTNLAPEGDKRTWAGSDFVNGQMPSHLDGVSVTVNGVPAYIYYISPTQINILTAPGAISGAVPVQVTNNGAASAAFTVQSQAQVPSFFVFNGGPYVAATHANGSLIGPSTLYPGYTTPAQPGETIVIYANGFGPTSSAVIAGASTQSGTLSPLPTIAIGGADATVLFAGLVAPGEYQFNVVVPPSLGKGDQPIASTYKGSSTQTGTLITLQ